MCNILISRDKDSNRSQIARIKETKKRQNTLKSNVREKGRANQEWTFQRQ